MSDSSCYVLCSKTKLHSQPEVPFLTQFNPYVLKSVSFSIIWCDCYALQRAWCYSEMVILLCPQGSTYSTQWNAPVQSVCCESQGTKTT